MTSGYHKSGSGGQPFVLSDVWENMSTFEIAWEAHIGGFLFGLVAFGFFDVRPMPASGVQRPY